MRLAELVTAIALMALLLLARSTFRMPAKQRRGFLSRSLGLAGSAFAPDLGPSGGRPVLVSIEGNIGAGKSTLLDALRAGETSRDWVFIDEPVGEWSTLKNEKGESMLEVFYKDRRRWSYTFQNCALLTRFQNIEAAIRLHSSKTGSTSDKRKVFVTERCLDTDYHVFTKMLRAEGSIDKLEYDLYERWFSQLKKTSTPLSAIVHVDTTPETCAQRIIMRGREGEGGISLEYLRSLDKYQRDWVEAGTTPFIRADVTQCSKVIEFVETICAGV